MPGLLVESYPVASEPPLSLARQKGLVVSGSDPERVLDILRPRVHLALWHRPRPRGLSKSLVPLLAAAPFAASVENKAEVATEALATLLPAQAPIDLLLDIRDLALLFAAVTNAPRLRLRLEALTGRGCYRWHADSVGLRLLTTYHGAGTQWLPLGGGAQVARGLDPEALPCLPNTVPTGSVAMFKGEAYPGNAGWGCIHRSPPAGPGSQTRLLLCIDETGRIPCR